MFRDRQQAGQLLAKKLTLYKGKAGVLIFGIPRGGMVVAKEVADALGIALDAVVVRKISTLANPELAIGAIGPANTVYWDKGLLFALKISKEEKQEALLRKRRERNEREKSLRK